MVFLWYYCVNVDSLYKESGLVRYGIGIGIGIGLLKIYIVVFKVELYEIIV